MEMRTTEQPLVHGARACTHAQVMEYGSNLPSSFETLQLNSNKDHQLQY